MQITEEMLLSQIVNLRAQETNALAVASEARGAIALAEHLLEVLRQREEQKGSPDGEV